MNKVMHGDVGLMMLQPVTGRRSSGVYPLMHGDNAAIVAMTVVITHLLQPTITIDAVPILRGLVHSRW